MFNRLIDPETGDYVKLPSGALELDDTAMTPVILQLREVLGAWWGNAELGADVARTMRGVPPANPGEALTAAAGAALDRLVESGRLATYEIQVKARDPLLLSVLAVDGGGNRVGLRIDAAEQAIRKV